MASQPTLPHPQINGKPMGFKPLRRPFTKAASFVGDLEGFESGTPNLPQRLTKQSVFVSRSIG